MWCCDNIVYVIFNTYAYVYITYVNYVYEQHCYTIMHICDIFSHYWKYEIFTSLNNIVCDDVVTLFML